MKNVLFLALATFGLSFSTDAFADQKCKDANLNITNSYKNGNNKVKIKVLAVNYRDKEDAKWRDNDIKNTEIGHGATKTVVETLEYVGNEEVPKIQIKFKYKENKGWSKAMWSNITDLASKDCKANIKYNINISGTAAKK